MNINKKIKNDKRYAVGESDRVSKETNKRVYKYLIDRVSMFKGMPMLGNRIDEISKTKDKFEELGFVEQCGVIEELLKVMRCNASTGDLSLLMPSASQLGKGICSAKISNYDSAFLINQSPTGLYEEVIDLKTIQPRALKQDKQ